MICDDDVRELANPEARELYVQDIISVLGFDSAGLEIERCRERDARCYA